MDKEDRKVVESGRAALQSGAFDMYIEPETSIKALIAIIDRLDDESIKQHDTIMNYRDEVGFLKGRVTQTPAMLSLLERWVEKLDRCLIAEHINAVYEDTKALLKEAKGE